MYTTREWQFWALGLLLVVVLWFVSGRAEPREPCPSGTALVWETGYSSAYSDGECYPIATDGAR